MSEIKMISIPKETYDSLIARVAELEKALERFLEADRNGFTNVSRQPRNQAEAALRPAKDEGDK